MKSRQSRLRGLVWRKQLMANRRRKLIAEKLEQRYLLAADWQAPIMFRDIGDLNVAMEGELELASTVARKLESYRMLGHSQFDTVVHSGDMSENITHQLIISNAASWGYTPADLTAARVTAHFTSAVTGITHITLQQVIDGIEVANANIHAQVTDDGDIVAFDGRFLTGRDLPTDQYPRMPDVLAVTEILANVAREQRLNVSATPRLAAGPYRWEDPVSVFFDDLSETEILVRMQYFNTPEGLHTTWNFVLEPPGQSSAYQINVDTFDSTILSQKDLSRSHLEQWLAGDLSSTLFTNTQTRYASPYHYYVDGHPVALEPIVDQLLVGLAGPIVGDLKSLVPSLHAAAINWSGSALLNPQTAIIQAAENAVAIDVAAALSVLDTKSWAGPLFRDPVSGATLLPNNEIIVALAEGTSPDEVFDGHISNYRPLRGTSNQFIIYVDVDTTFETLELANSLNDDPRTTWATPEFYSQIKSQAIPNEFTPQTTPWHVTKVKLDEAWDDETGSTTPIVIAVIDNGVQLNHYDLDIYVNPGEIPGNGIDDDGNGYIDDVHGWDFHNDDNNPSPHSPHDNHGTAVAGMAAALGNNNQGLAGASWNATILPIKIASDDLGDGSGFAKSAQIAEAILYAKDIAQIQNHSWGSSGSNTAVNSALLSAQAAGRVLIAASGNDSSGTVAWPASHSSTIAVGATTSADSRAAFSQYGAALDVVAPGASVLTTDRTGIDGYTVADTATLNGTSFAAPLVSGIVALMLSKNPTLTESQIRQFLRQSADKIGGVTYDANGFHQEYGYGRVNAKAALDLVATTP